MSLYDLCLIRFCLTQGFPLNRPNPTILLHKGQIKMQFRFLLVFSCISFLSLPKAPIETLWVQFCTEKPKLSKWKFYVISLVSNYLENFRAWYGLHVFFRALSTSPKGEIDCNISKLLTCFIPFNFVSYFLLQSAVYFVFVSQLFLL